ncbi:MAG: hypothetical protein KJO07_20355 [Deltaproteobacteria bacterium]|nr:hypothetical protein [Deltaproteobacteria bacterium]
MRSALLLIFVLCLGCDDDFFDELPDTEAMAVCLAPSGTASLPVNPEPVVVTISGTVEASGIGMPPDGCFEGPGASRWGAPAARTAWFRVFDDSDGWTVGVALDDVERIAEGRQVSFDYRFAFGGFSPEIGSLAVSDDRGLRVYVGRGGDVDDLRLPDEIIEVERGATVYRQEDECGTWEAFELEVRTRSDGRETLEYGEEEDHGGSTLYHGGYRQDRGKTDCADWFISDLSLAWQRD